MEHTGKCACGAVHFKTTAPVLGVGICHCTECQKLSGGAANYVALVPKGTLEVTKGEAKIFNVKGDSGEQVGRAFCPECGTPLWSIPADGPLTPIKLGALDNNGDFKPEIHIYTASAPKWHLFHDGLPQFEGMPPPMPTKP